MDPDDNDRRGVGRGHEEYVGGTTTDAGPG